MKLPNSNCKVELSSDISGIDFGIKEIDKGLIIDILRSKIYKDPIAAICRELMSNSRDANREVGKGDDPIRVSIYDKEGSLIEMGLGLSISFEDDGPGISPERMSDIYVNYGSSTKRDTNDQTGGFGLGAKTPFSYTDNFAIITKVEGVKYFYIAAIEESRTGKVYLFKKEETEEKNGTSIVVPIKSSDRYDYENKVLQVSRFWSVKPEYMDFKSRPLYSDVKKYEGVVVTGGSTGLTLLIDEIPYQTDLSILDLNVNGHYVLPFKTGQLTLSATRENVQYDDKTKRLICDRYKKAIVILEKRAQGLVDKCETYLQAFCLLPEMRMNDPLVRALPSTGDTFYRGQKIVSTLVSSGVNIECYSRHGKTHDNRTMYKNPVYYMDRRIDKRRNEAVLKGGIECFYLIILPEDFKNFSSLSFKSKKLNAVCMRRAVKHLKWLESIGLKWKMYSEIKPIRVHYEKDKSYIPCYTVQYKDSEVKFSMSSVRVKDYEESKDKYLYHVYELPKIRSREIGELKKWAYFIGKTERLEKDIFKWKKVIFVSRTNEKFFKDHGTTLLSDVINKLHCAYVQELSNKMYLRDRNVDKGFLRALSVLKGLEKVKGISNFLKTSYGDISASLLPTDFKKLYPPNINISVVKEIKDKYPLLDCICDESDARTYKKALEEYIELINNKERFYAENPMDENSYNDGFCL